MIKNCISSIFIIYILKETYAVFCNNIIYDKNNLLQKNDILQKTAYL
jgi:hypothetical protein